jgi:TRAP-type mannitol/chloroaromatic compound transport system permease small subunit
MDKWQRLGLYASFLVFFAVILIVGLRYQTYLYSQTKEYYDILPFYRFSSFFFVAIGMLLAFPHLIRTHFQSGSWSVDWLKLTLFGLPLFYAWVVPLLYFMAWAPSVKLPFASFLMGGYFGNTVSTSFDTIIGVLLGYVILNSVIKRKKS